MGPASVSFRLLRARIERARVGALPRVEDRRPPRPPTPTHPRPSERATGAVPSQGMPGRRTRIGITDGGTPNVT
jgi:hypothetical protein